MSVTLPALHDINKCWLSRKTPNQNCCFVDFQLWIGTKRGKILIYNVLSKDKWKELSAHEDAVRVLFYVEGRYVISGAGSNDGKIAIWSATANTTDSGNFIELTSSNYHF